MPGMVSEPRLKAGVACVVFVMLGCTAGGQPLSAGSEASARSPVEMRQPVFPVPADATADVIFYNGTILTMDASQTTAEAVAIQRAIIVAVGGESKVLALRGSDTQVVDLAGRTLVPGFVDSHAHRLMKWEEGGYASMGEAAQDALSNGWTSTNELSVGQTLLDDMAALDRAGGLPLRVNAYLTLNYWPDIYGDWYALYEPGAFYSPHVRLAGVKIFTDGGWGEDIWLTQAEVDDMVATAHQAGWQISVHAIGETGSQMALDAFARAVEGDPHPGQYRYRIEHDVFLRDDEIEQMRDLGVIASVDLTTVGNFPGMSGFQKRLADDPGTRQRTSRWHDLLDAGVVTAGGTDAPFMFAEFPEGAPYGSPMRTIYQAVTRTGDTGAAPDPWLLDQAITVDEALHMLTIYGAYATFEEGVKGSITPGKFADLVVLSGDPLGVPTSALLDIQVLMTMIGGKVEYCALGEDLALCPSPSSP